MKHFLFEELETGEEFIVSADNIQEAKIEAKNIAKTFLSNGWKLHFICELTNEEAEASGLDEY